MDRIERLERDVFALASQIGPRNLLDDERAANLHAAAAYITARMAEVGYVPIRQSIEVGDRSADVLVAELRGTTEAGEIIVVSAHYDTYDRSPGADDDASGVAVLLALAEDLRHAWPKKTIRFVAFPNEEQPFTRTEKMGSRVYARGCRERGERIVGMISLECVGAYDREYDGPHAPASMRLLPTVVPDMHGDFVAVVSNFRSRALAKELCEALSTMRSTRVKRVVAPGVLPLVKSSDHWSFWKEGFPAVMITDGAMLRYREYHREDDRVDVIDFARLADLSAALGRGLGELARVAFESPMLEMVRLSA